MDIFAAIEAYIGQLETEVMAIIQNPKMDKREKNLAMKPLVSKKKILLNTIDSLRLVDTICQESAQEETIRFKPDASW